jgi:signal transduction histidine kinase
MKPLSIRQRIFFGLFILGSVFTSAFAIVIGLSGEYLEKQYINFAYNSELQRINNEYKINKYLPNSTHTIGFLASNNNVPDFFLKYDTGSHHEIFWQNHTYHLFVKPLNNDTLYLAFEISLIEEYEENLTFVVVSLTAIGIISSIILGLWFTGIMARPVTNLARTIKQLSPNDTKLALRTDDQDLNVIEDAIESYLQKLAGFLIKEKQFSGITSHELRTPLTTILATVETLLEDETLEKQTKIRIARIHRSALDMQYVSESLLQLIKFSPEKILHLSPWPISNLLTELIKEYQALKRDNKIDLIFEFQSEYLSTALPEIVKLIIGNLIRNALQHTRAGTIKVRLADNKITVSDTGSGMSEGIIEKYNQSSTDDILASESGLGLIIVSRLCHQIGWQSSLAKNTENGLIVSIQLN